jgi:hypothetical protein
VFTQENGNNSNYTGTSHNINPAEPTTNNNMENWPQCATDRAGVQQEVAGKGTVGRP